ncbi:MAG TPA: methyl-accepting chemotaxis protein [Ramlibacter sp.]
MHGPVSRGFTIRMRLGLAFALFVAMFIAMTVVATLRLQELDRKTTELATINLRMERLVGEWLSFTRANAVRATVLTRSDDEEIRRMLTPEVEATTKRISELQAQIEKLLDSGQARQLFDTVGEKRKAYLAARQRVLEKKKAGDAAEAAALMDSAMLPALRTYVESIKTMADHFGTEVEHDAAAAHQAAIVGRNVLAAMSVLGVVLAVLFSVLLMRSITRPLDEAVQAARRVASGDLSVDVQPKTRDEMGQLLGALADMTARLRDLVSQVAGGARTVAETSSQIAQGNVDLSQRTEEQAGTLEETASSIEELTSTVAQNASNAREASLLAASASQVARKGGDVVGQVVSTMSGISESSRRISDIIGVIDGIAFQTNILALNAAVEAARAGEQGRGFAVVATEVRNLAQRSAQAAKEIKTLIGTSVSQVEAGGKLVDAAGRTMEDIVASVQKVNDLITEIAAASQEQSSGIEQVNQAVTQMDQVVQQNATLVEEATAATESMKAQSDALLQLVSSFRLGAAARGYTELTPLKPAPEAAARQQPAPIRFVPGADKPVPAEPVPLAAPGLRPAVQGAWREF